MPTLFDTLSAGQRLALAVRSRSPAHLARQFALYEGQFYDRAAFDHLACETRALYAAGDPVAGAEFRARLDRHLAARDRQPVAWDVPCPTAEVRR